VTDPVDRGNEIRAYIRDPDGHLIEVGQWQIDVIDRCSG
jgi:catechol 2,3-dioxygenase-like lactoylglutathione lyase family enzyme